jgi:hypothetical protein
VVACKHCHNVTHVSRGSSSLGASESAAALTATGANCGCSNCGILLVCSGLIRPGATRGRASLCRVATRIPMRPCTECGQTRSPLFPIPHHLTLVNFFTCVGRLLDRLASLVLHAERAHAILSVAATETPDLDSPKALCSQAEVWTEFDGTGWCPAEKKT